MSYPQDTTKPSRVSRRLKRRWKKPVKIADLIKSGLTDCYRVATIAPLLKKMKVWSRNQSIGHKRPLLNVVFLCPPKTLAQLRRVLSIMVGLFGQRSALAGSYAGFRPHLSPPPDTVESISGGYPLYIGVTA